MSKEQKPKVSPLMNALIGGITGAIEISITYPTEYTKTVMQLYPEINKKGAINVVRDTIKEGGYFPEVCILMALGLPLLSSALIPINSKPSRISASKEILNSQL